MRYTSGFKQVGAGRPASIAKIFSAATRDMFPREECVAEPVCGAITTLFSALRPSAILGSNS